MAEGIIWRKMYFYHNVKLLKRYICLYISCTYPTWMCSDHRGHKWCQIPLELDLQAVVTHPTWVLGPKLRAFAGAASILRCWGASRPHYSAILRDNQCGWHSPKTLNFCEIEVFEYLWSTKPLQNTKSVWLDIKMLSCICICSWKSLGINTGVHLEL